jgi:hypothetical protein
VAEDKVVEKKLEKKGLFARLKEKFKRAEAREEHPPTAQRMNLAFIFLTVGALIGASLAGVVGRLPQFRQRLLMTALLCLGAAALVAVTPGSDFAAAHADYGLASLMADPRLWMAALIALLYFPLEASLSTWAQTYFKDLAFSARGTTLLIICFWATFVGARLATAWLLPAGFEMWLVLILALLIAITLGNLAGTFNRTNGALAFLLIAASAGPFLPTFLSAAGEVSGPGPISATALGGLFAIGTVGCLLFERPLRGFAQSHSIRETLRLPMILALVLSIPALVLALIRN